jgi:hypothetical protein
MLDKYNRTTLAYDIMKTQFDSVRWDMTQSNGETEFAADSVRLDTTIRLYVIQFQYYKGIDSGSSLMAIKGSSGHCARSGNIH